MNWLPIESAPKDGSIIELRDAKHQFHAAMKYNKRKKIWEGMAFGIMGPSKTWWDESFVKIHEWRQLTCATSPMPK